MLNVSIPTQVCVNSMIETGKNQSLMATGESGSGKTTVIRHILEYITTHENFSEANDSPFLTPLPFTAFLDLSNSHSLVFVALSTTAASSSASFLD